MKKFINYIKESQYDVDKDFVDEIHLKDLEIKFNFISNKSRTWPKALIYTYNNDMIFYYCRDNDDDTILLNDKYFYRFIYDIIDKNIKKYFNNNLNTSQLSSDWVNHNKYHWI